MARCAQDRGCNTCRSTEVSLLLSWFCALLLVLVPRGLGGAAALSEHRKPVGVFLLVTSLSSALLEPCTRCWHSRLAALAVQAGFSDNLWVSVIFVTLWLGQEGSYSFCCAFCVCL